MNTTATRKSPVEFPPRPAPRVGSVAAALVMIVLVVAGVLSVDSLGINLATIARSLDNGVAFIQRMFPLDFPPVAETVSLIFETLAIVFLATFLAVVLSVPLALAAAKATTRGRLSQALPAR